MRTWEKLRKLNKSPFTTKADRWRVATSGGYQFDRRIFLGLGIIVVLFALYGLFRYDFDFSPKVYLHCVGPERCANPLYKTCDEWYCGNEYLPPGYEYGEKPDKFFNRFPLFVGVLCFVALVLNHFLLNRGYMPRELP